MSKYTDRTKTVIIVECVMRNVKLSLHEVVLQWSVFLSSKILKSSGNSSQTLKWKSLRGFRDNHAKEVFTYLVTVTLKIFVFKINLVFVVEEVEVSWAALMFDVINFKHFAVALDHVEPCFCLQSERISV